MKLTRKDLHHTPVRGLSDEERDAIHNVWGEGRSASADEVRIAGDVISDMDDKGFYLECDCLPSGSSQAWNCEVRKTFLRRGKTAPEHDRQCPLFHLRQRAPDRAGADSEEERAIAPLVPVDINDIFSHKVTQGKQGGSEERHGRRRRTRLKPVPSLGRVLFTLLHDAGINTMALLPVPSTPGLPAVLSTLSSHIKSLTFKNGVTGSHVITTDTSLSPEAQERMMCYLENDKLKWEGGRNREFFMIGYSETLEENKVIFKLSGKELPPIISAKPIKTFGESITNIGTKAPYWVILRFRRGDNGIVYCDEGYAHCAFKKHNPIPVDSERERATLKTIERAGEYVRSQNTKAGKPLPTVTVQKPLFTKPVAGEETGTMEVHPDFLIEIMPAGTHLPVNLVVETMGYDSPDYMERKHKTHPGMKQLGHLLTDPHGYPKESERTFYQELLSCLFQPVRHRQV